MDQLENFALLCVVHAKQAPEFHWVSARFFLGYGSTHAQLGLRR